MFSYIPYYCFMLTIALIYTFSHKDNGSIFAAILWYLPCRTVFDFFPPQSCISHWKELNVDVEKFIIMKDDASSVPRNRGDSQYERYPTLPFLKSHSLFSRNFRLKFSCYRISLSLTPLMTIQILRKWIRKREHSEGKKTFFPKQLSTRFKTTCGTILI